ncbi:uncharacterized protein LOC126984112 [Eriocheir sinensis]|uniref:uncharacterized protein LOC126984112 n=1 Tax=Eriocheir sinensis TaxID=95602 RepID=UPI0021C9C4F7|nr:uncharacterized protein LOC126984112 [Eriocheir sinensis]
METRDLQADIAVPGREMHRLDCSCRFHCTPPPSLRHSTTSSTTSRPTKPHPTPTPTPPLLLHGSAMSLRPGSGRPPPMPHGLRASDASRDVSRWWARARQRAPGGSPCPGPDTAPVYQATGRSCYPALANDRTVTSRRTAGHTRPDNNPKTWAGQRGHAEGHEARCREWLPRRAGSRLACHNTPLGAPKDTRAASSGESEAGSQQAPITAPSPRPSRPDIAHISPAPSAPARDPSASRDIISVCSRLSSTTAASLPSSPSPPRVLSRTKE